MPKCCIRNKKILHFLLQATKPLHEQLIVSCHFGCTTGAQNSSAAPEVVVPDTVSFSPPPYSGDNTGVPHPGPPPYCLGSGSSINSVTLPRCPPPYQQIAKESPPSYSSATCISISLPEDEEKKTSSPDDKDTVEEKR